MDSTQLQSLPPASDNSATIPEGTAAKIVPEQTMLSEFMHYKHPSAEESAKSRVLRNLELLELVMTHLQGLYPSWTLSDRREMASVALTCKDFLDPTLNIVWRTVVSWSSILVLIPTAERFDQDNGPTYLTTTAALTPQHLERLDYYVRRIRYFQVVASKEEISPHIFAYISKLRHFQLFPALTTLHIPSIESIMDRDIPALYLTPSPTLSVVKINNIMTMQSQLYATSLLNDISERCPRVISLTMGGALDGMIFSALKGFDNLETLNVCIWDVDLTFSAFPTLPNLKYFKIIIMDSSLTWVFADPKGVIPLDGLQKLEITGSPTHINQFLQRSSLSTMAHVSICYTDVEDKPSPGRCLRTLLQKDGAKTTLRSIKIFSGVDLYIPITGEALMQCSRVMPPHLESLELQLIDVSRESLCSILSTLACRDHLKHLKLDNQIASPRRGDNNNNDKVLPYEVSELDLISSSLPNLITATIPVSLGMATESQMQKMRKQLITTDGTINHGLEGLTLLPIAKVSSASRRNETNSVTTDAAVIAASLNAYFLARYIDHMFPRLKVLNFGNGVLLMRDNDSSCKSMVRKFIKEFQEERKAKNQLESSVGLP